MNIETVNEIIQSLESAGELSIREQKFLKLAKAYQQLAAENVGLKQFPEQIVKFISGLGTSELGSDTKERIERAANRVKTPATDRIVAGIKADGVEAFAAHLRDNDNGASVCKMIALGADDFAKQLREGAK